MNRKLLNGLLLLTIATGGVATFTSCKDTEDMTRNEFLAGQKSLSDQITAIRNITDSNFRENLNKWLDDAINNASGGEYGDLKDLVLEVSYLQGELNLLEGIVNGIDGRVGVLEGKVGALDEAFEQMGIRVDGLETQITYIVDVLLADLTDRVKVLEDRMKDLGVLEGRVDELEKWQKSAESDIADALAQGLANAAAIEALESNMNKLQDRITALENNYESLNGAIADLENEIANLKAADQDLQNQIDALVLENGDIINRLNQITLDLTNLSDKVKELEDLVKQLQDCSCEMPDLDKFNQDMAKLYSFLANKFAKFITSIPVHQTYNPIFGTVNLPIGLQSNIVATYYFSSDHSVTFPILNDVSWEYWTNNPANDETTINHIIALNPERVKYSANTNVLPEGDNNMGEIYLSVNPQSVNANGMKVSLVNSQNEEILTNSDLYLYSDNETVLNFGVTRSGSSLYRLPVYLTPDQKDIDQIRFDIDNKGELLSAFKSALTNHQIGDFASLGKLIYNQLDGFLPAYAVKVSWQDEEINADGTVSNIENAVYSNYNIAATCFRPLSYRSGWGFSVDKQLPTFSPVSEYLDKIVDKIREEVNFYIGKVKDKAHDYDITIDFSNITYDIDWNTYDLTLYLKGLPVYKDGELAGTITEDIVLTFVNDGTGRFVYNGDDYSVELGNFVAAIENAIQSSFDVAQDRLQSRIDDLLNKINSELDSLQGKIDEKLDDVLDRIHNALSGKLRYADKLVDLYNKLARRVNVLLKDPNHYLQVMMAYNAGDGLHHLSNTVMDPTVFRKANGNCIELYATSYNAELIVPSFKKYVAITNVYYPKGQLIPGGGFDLREVNAAAGLNNVLDGRQQRVAIDVTNKSYFQPGYIYEIYYSSLDYRGYTSTQKYYFTIK